MSAMIRRSIAGSTVFMMSAVLAMTSQQSSGVYENSLVVAPHYVEFVTDTDERFAHQASELKRRLGSAPHVLVGFAASLPIQIPAVDPGQKLEKQMAGTFEAIDRIVERARKNHV